VFQRPPSGRNLPETCDNPSVLVIQVDNLIIPPAISAADYMAQLETEGLSEEDAAVLKQVREEGGIPDDEAASPQQTGGAPPQLQHLFKKHFRQGRFLIATNSEGAAARVIRDLGFAAFVNAPAAFIARIDVRDVDQMAVMQVSRAHRLVRRSGYAGGKSLWTALSLQLDQTCPRQWTKRASTASAPF